MENIESVYMEMTNNNDAMPKSNPQSEYSYRVQEGLGRSSCEHYQQRNHVLHRGISRDRLPSTTTTATTTTTAAATATEIIQHQQDREMDEEQLKKRNFEFMERCIKWKGEIGRMELSFNPISSISAALILWLIVIWALVDHSSIIYFKQAQRWITDQCTWIYVATQALWAGFIIVIYFKYGHLKLGLPNDVPEYSNFDYFVMIFTTGLCNGVIYDAVVIPLSLYDVGGNSINYWGKLNEGSRSQNALNILVYHYGFHGFSVYLIPALLIAALVHRKGLPLTMRSCFYPIFGKTIFGRLGDIVDSLSIICICFGVSTSFMIGSVLLIVGLNQMTPKIEITSNNFCIATWVVTLMSSISAVSGMKLGIRRMSQLCFSCGLLFFFVIVLSDDTWFVLNLLVQSVGYYFQYVIGMSGYTGAFEQKNNLPDQTSNEAEWMHSYTIFYWGWWIGWAPLVGMFIARLSKGRYIKDVINYAFFLPIVVAFVWLVGIGGLAIDMKHQALKFNVTCDESRNQLHHVPKWVKMLECDGSQNKFYALINKYEDISFLLRFLAMAIVFFYYTTSFDSSALVIGSISSNGEPHPPLAQRIFWCLTLGGSTTAFVYYENRKGLDQVHAFAVICGVPFTVVLCIICMALWRLLKKEPGWKYEMDVQWKMLYGGINSLDLLKHVTLAIFFPWYYLAEIVIAKKKFARRKERIFTYLKFAIPLHLWVLFMVLSVWYRNVCNFGWVILAGLAIYSAIIRRKTRERYNIDGNIIEDICLMLLYPLTIIQMYDQRDVTFPVTTDIAPQVNCGIYNDAHAFADEVDEVFSKLDARPRNGQTPFDSSPRNEYSSDTWDV